MRSAGPRRPWGWRRPASRSGSPWIRSGLPQGLRRQGNAVPGASGAGAPVLCGPLGRGGRGGGGGRRLDLVRRGSDRACRRVYEGKVTPFPARLAPAPRSYAVRWAAAAVVVAAAGVSIWFAVDPIGPAAGFTKAR